MKIFSTTNNLVRSTISFIDKKGNPLERLNEVSDYCIKSSYDTISQLGARNGLKNVKICQKGEDLLLINLGTKTVPLRPSEITKSVPTHFSEETLANYSDKELEQMHDRILNKAVLSKIYKNL